MMVEQVCGLTVPPPNLQADRLLSNSLRRCDYDGNIGKELCHEHTHASNKSYDLHRSILFYFFWGSNSIRLAKLLEDVTKFIIR